MSKLLNCYTADDGQVLINLNEAASLLDNLSSWHFEFSSKNISFSNETFFLNIFSLPSVLCNLIFNAGGELEISFTGLFTCTIPFGNGTYRIELSPSGNVHKVDGVQVTPSYSIGDASSTAAFGFIGSSINSQAFGGSVFDIKFGDISIDLAHFPIMDGSGNALSEIVGGIDGSLSLDSGQSPSWIEESAKISTLNFPIFSELPEVFGDDPTNSQWAVFATKDGTPIKHSGDWSSYGYGDIFWNENALINSEDITCMSVWSEISETYRFPATLLSPRHVLLSEHVIDDDAGRYAGAGIEFLSSSGQRQRTTLLDSENVSGDLTIGILEDDITIGVEFAKFLPESFVENYVLDGAYRFLQDWPAVCVTRDSIYSLERCVGLFLGATIGAHNGFRYSASRHAQYNWSRYSISDVRTGDSQRPQFIYNGDSLFLIGAAFSVGDIGKLPYSGSRTAGTGTISPSVHVELDAMKSTMDSLDTLHERSPSYELVRGTI